MRASRAWSECDGVLIIGKVVHLEADGRFFSEAEGMDYERAKPLCAMGGPNGMQFVNAAATGCSSKYASMQSAPKGTE
jgi:flavin reductase (DIM6/NTAB) family NADH-FMN oxidoreductase RutF